ncbi:MAG: hypothetical protein IPK60_20505 [Sandaracinaceae bacterium]|nr:hypothetical protein [Sandaracinaceae bacterium]
MSNTSVRVSIAFCGLAALVAAAPLWKSLSAAAPAGASAAIEGDAHSLPALAIRAGLDAEALAAVGATSNQTGSVVSALASAHANLAVPISALDATATTARVARDAAQRKIRSGAGSQQEIEGFPALETALTTAESARASALAALRASATAGLSGAQRSDLDTIESNRRWKMPIEFLVIERSDAEWLSLRNALSNERISAKYEDEANGTLQATLAAARADERVAAAKASLETNLASLQQAWNSATSG